MLIYLNCKILLVTVIFGKNIVGDIKYDAVELNQNYVSPHKSRVIPM